MERRQLSCIVPSCDGVAIKRQRAPPIIGVVFGYILQQMANHSFISTSLSHLGSLAFNTVTAKSIFKSAFFSL